METKKKFTHRGRTWTLQFRGQAWYLAAMIHGRRINRSLQTGSLRDAVDSARAFLDHQYKTGHDQSPERSPLGTWGEYIEAFEEKAATHVSGKNVRHYVWVLGRALRDMIGDGYLEMKTDSPTPQQVEAYRQNVLRKRAKDEVSVATGRRYVNSMIRQLKAFTSNTWQERLGIKLGAGSVAIKEARRFSRVPTPVFRYSPELLERTMKWAEGLRDTNVDAYRVFWFAIGTGARRSEIAKLKWEHFVTDVDPVVVQGDFLTKDGSLACLQFVYTEAWVKWCALPADSYEGWVFGGPQSRRAERAFRFLCDRMRGLGWTGRFKLHELRAAVITKAFETHGMGAAQSIARHKNASTTDKYIRARTVPVGRIEF